MAAVCLGDVHVANTFGLQPWVWVSVMVFAPKFSGNHYHVDVLKPPSLEHWRSYAAFFFVCAICYLFAPVVVGRHITSARWMTLYLLFGFLFRIANVLRGEVGGSDNACHLGGSLIGLLWGCAVLGGVFVQGETWVCLLYLASLVANDLYRTTKVGG